MAGSMAVVGGTVTDDALYGIPAPDYSDTEDDSSSNKPRPTTSPTGTTDDVTDRLHTHSLKDDKHQTDEELGIPKPDYSSDEDDVKQSKNKHSNVTGDSRSGSDSLSPVTTDAKLLSPDGSVEGLSLNLEDKNRGSFRSSGSRSPISPIMGVSHEHAAVDPVLIEAKKIPVAPQLTKEQKELQRELQFKQKQGNMLEKKPELKKAMDDRKFKMKKEELKKEQENKQSTFNVKMGKQAMKLLQLEEQNEKQKLTKTNSSPADQQLDEFKKIHSKIHKNNKLTS